MSITKQGGWVGRSMKRVEDPKFLMGKGRYIDEISLPGMLHGAVVRSSHPHARIVSVETARARALDGVAAVVTGSEAAELCGPLPDLGPEPEKHVWRCLAADKVRYVGEAVVAVAATSRAVAEDACALVEVEYEPLPAIVDPEGALADSANLVHEALGTNCAFTRRLATDGIDAAMKQADLVLGDRLRWNRSGAQPLETVGAVADYNAGTRSMTIYENSLTFVNFLFMLAETLGIPSHKLVVHPTPAGGSFGSKTWAVKVPAIAGILSKLSGRPVKYLEDRFDNLSNCDHHGSDRIYDVELGVDRDGTLRALSFDVIDDYGAYIQYGVGTHANALSQVTGPYKIPEVAYRVTAVLTNKCQQGACRGFGSEAHNWALERMIDLAARELEMDPIALRRKNFIPSDEFPYKTAFGNEYDSGDYGAVLDRALELVDVEGWRRTQTEAHGEGRCIGIGVATANERSVFSGTELGLLFDPPARVSSMPESINVAVDALGNVTATLYSGAFWGSSAETVVVQLLADELGISPETINVVYGGSNPAFPSTGPAGSRFTVMIAGAIAGAAEKIREKGKRIAAALLEADPADLEWQDGGAVVRGTPESRKELGEIAAMAQMFKHSLPEDIESGLEGSQVFDHPRTRLPTGDGTDLGTWFPFVGHACHIAVVEVDQELGTVRFLDYAAVHDNGTVVNPRGLSGQVLGGTAHGIGTALMEQYDYDSDGAFRSTSFQHYLLPTAMEVPEIKVDHVETPSPFSPRGIKGGGEAGRLMAPAAISAAIDDALRDRDVRVDTLPATPERIALWANPEPAPSR